MLHTEIYTASKDVVEQSCKVVRNSLATFIRFKCEGYVGSLQVTFYSSWGKAALSGRKVAAVHLLVLRNKNVIQSTHSMEPFIAPEYCYKQPLQVFHCDNVPWDDCDLSFVVHFVSTLNAYQTHLRDSLFSQELWASRINKERTNVEFQVGGKTFPAHRALLAARCPELAALIPAESSPSPSTPSVSLPDMDPIVFEDVLYFLYTGSIRHLGDSEEETYQQRLADAARMYKIGTLSCVMLERHEVDEDELFKVLMGIF